MDWDICVHVRSLDCYLLSIVICARITSKPLEWSGSQADEEALSCLAGETRICLAWEPSPDADFKSTRQESKKVLKNLLRPIRSNPRGSGRSSKDEG